MDQIHPRLVTVLIIEPNPPLLESAARLTGLYELRALDAIHLACALFHQQAPISPISFATADRRLQTAAPAEGLTVPTPPIP